MAPLRNRFRLLVAIGLVTAALAHPAGIAAHAALVSSEPSSGATVAAPFAGPIILTYSEALRTGSHAELLAPGGAKVADAAIDSANAARLVFTLASPLAPGAYTIQWTSIAQDRDVERGQLAFTVTEPTPAPTLPPTAPPTAPPATAPTATLAPAASPAPATSPTPSSTPAGQTPVSTTDVIIPIVAALALVGVAGVLLLRRRGGTP
jgi:methionine-rich copper-binding protein CopC